MPAVLTGEIMAGTQWFVRLPEGDIGPMAPADVRSLVASGRIAPETELRRSDQGGWLRASQIRGLMPAAAAGLATALAVETPGPNPLLPQNPYQPPVERGRIAGHARANFAQGFRSPRTLAVVLSILLGLSAISATVLSLIDGVVSLSDIAAAEASTELLDEFDIGVFGRISEQGSLALVVALGAIAISTIVLWCMWTHRCNRNLGSLGCRGKRFSASASWGWFFCPIANLWMPFLAMREIWTWSDPDESVRVVQRRELQRRTGRRVRGSNAGQGSGSGLVLAWWIAFVVGSFTDNVDMRLGWRAESFDEYRIAAYASIVAGAVGLVSCGLASALVWKLTQRQELRAQTLREHAQEGAS